MFETNNQLITDTPAFGGNGLGKFIFYRTYSREKEDKTYESWAECVRRVVNGTFSVRKNHYEKYKLHWDESFWQDYASGFEEYLFKMKFLPPGRGLWAMGTDFVMTRGSAPLYNCAYVEATKDNLANEAHWAMDMLMCGSGVGFGVKGSGPQIYKPLGVHSVSIPDSREGWCDSVKELINSYLLPNQLKPIFNYDLIRAKGEPIKGFGGVSSGSEPLIYLHQQIREFFENYTSWTRLVADLFNAIGSCVVAGNVRRSAEIMVGDIEDDIFMNLKNYEQNPERLDFGWISNNSPKLMETKHFDKLGDIARLVKVNGEPGVINGKNMPFGRIGNYEEFVVDQATGFNPCGEIPLESFEVCNLAETNPTICVTDEEWIQALKYATFYCSTVSLLPTHRPETNAIVARNRRIGVGITDYCRWVENNSQNKVTTLLRKGYKVVKEANKEANQQAGVPPAIRVTTMKPGGTVPKLPGVNSGMSFANFQYVLRRVRLGTNTPLCKLLMEQGVRNEPDVTQPDSTVIFEFPWKTTEGRVVGDVSLWEQAMNLVTLQHNWSDNAVSNTLFFKAEWEVYKAYDREDFSIIESEYLYEVLNEEHSIIHRYAKGQYKYKIRTQYGKSEILILKHNPNHEEDDIERVLSSIVPFVKSISLLPYSRYGVYDQMPESGLTEEEYLLRIAEIGEIDYSELRGKITDLEADKYCSSESCEI